MSDVLTLLKSLERPRLLVEAARYGVALYRREGYLRRVLGQSETPSPRQAALRLYCLEQAHEDARRTGQAAYSPAAHVEVLAALMAESRALMDMAGEEKPAPRAFLRAV